MDPEYPTRHEDYRDAGSHPAASQGQPATSPYQASSRQWSQSGSQVANSPVMRTEVLRQAGPVVLAWLVVVSGPYVGHIFRLQPEATVMGRDPGCDIVVDDMAVSRQHAKVRLLSGEDKQPRFVLHDLASENGTLLNGEPVIRSDLKDGDIVSIGRTELVFKQVLRTKPEAAKRQTTKPETTSETT